MRKGHKRWGAAGAALLLVGASAVYLRHKSAPHHRAKTDDAREPGDPVWRGFATGTITPGLTAPTDAGGLVSNGWMSDTISTQQLEAAMGAWRQSILERRQDAVITLDRAFAMFPGRYGPELLKAAETDPEERVRAFSTRVLGKIKNPQLVDVFQHLLADKSPFVRQNAAWALGELADKPDGREAAEVAIGELQHSEAADPAQAVRAAATEALKRLQ